MIGVIGTVLALLGLPAMYLRAAVAGGVIWLVGVVLVAITGMLFGIFLGLTGALVFPALATLLAAATLAPGAIAAGPSKKTGHGAVVPPKQGTWVGTYQEATGPQALKQNRVRDLESLLGRYRSTAPMPSQC